VFEALLAVLQALAEEEPVLLVIEDLHWADSSTRSFIGFLSRTMCSERLLIVGTYRSDELHRRHPLRPLLAELGSDPYSRLIELPRFTREELGEQLAGILADPPRAELVERVFARSEGNALYAEEILAAGLDGRGALPPTLRDALMLRVERLSKNAQDVLQWLACRPAADHALVAAVAGLEPGDLHDALREAVASNIVVTVDDESYGFRHALLREVIYDDLLPGERTAMHAALARALQDRIDAGDSGAHITAAAAHHWASAGDQPQALAAAVRAAVAAERVNAFGEELALFERALGLWERVPDPETVVDMGQIDLLRRAAFAADQAGDPARQEALLRRAFELVGDEHANAGACALLRERLSQSLWSQHRQDEAIEELKRGLALFPDGDQSAERATLLSYLAKKRMVQIRLTEAKDTAEEALAIARASGNREAEGRSLNALGTALGMEGDVEAGVQLLHESLDIASELGHEMDMAGAWVNIADILNLAGRTPEALEVAREGLDAESSRPWRTVAWLRLSIAEFLYYLGDWDEAEAMIPDESRRHSGGTLLLWQVGRAVIALGRGDLELAEEALSSMDRAVAGMTEPQFVGPYGVMRAELARRRGEIDRARTTIDDTIDRIEYCSDDMARITALSSEGLRVEGDAGEAARDRQDADAEQHARERADALIERTRLAAESCGPVEEAELATAEAEYARATDGSAAPAGLWNRAAAAWEGLGRPYPVAYARWREAEALMVGRDRDGAARAASDGLARARKLGSAWLIEEIESLAARARLQMGEGVPAPAAAASNGDEADDPFGLTPRERDVLALVASGATNREIGERLHMAEKTASVHVSRILAKLSVRSRTEAAAVAHRQGLTDTASIG
jgi:ATP/maltotriose-dependent transcriptional regulator MalT